MHPDAVAREHAIRELAAHGITARFSPAEDESVDDAIVVLLLIDGKEVMVGELQICFDRTFSANIWTDGGDTMLHGEYRHELGAATKDIVAMLIKEGHTAVLTDAQIAFPDFDDVDSIRRLIGEGWQEMSWKNDTCPRLTKGRVGIWVDYLDETKSEFASVQKAMGHERHRFSVHEINAAGEPIAQSAYDFIDCDTLEDALSAAAKINASPPRTQPT